MYSQSRNWIVVLAGDRLNAEAICCASTKTCNLFLEATIWTVPCRLWPDNGRVVHQLNRYDLRWIAKTPRDRCNGEEFERVG